MGLVLLIGGARSGKSSAAHRLAETSGEEVVLIATGEPRDAEMAERIRLHRLARPATWSTIEQPVDVLAALERVPEKATVILDCLTLWVSNLLGRGDEPADVLGVAERTARLAAERAGSTIAVTNEVGLGIVPFEPETRTYRDLLGRVNAIVAAAAERVAFLVAGRVLWLDPLSEEPT